MNLFDIPHTHYLCTAEDSQSLDRSTIEDFGISGYTLMEVAGSKTAQHLLNDYSKGDRGLFLCGKGNNGGDALVVARYLVQYGIEVTLVFISGVDELSNDAEKNYNLLREMSRHTPHQSLIHFITSWNPEKLGQTPDFIVDGMLGTGLDSELRGDYKSAVQWANDKDVDKYAIDIPTGLHADTGKIMGDAMRVDYTFTFGALKQGFFLNNGPQTAGDPVYCDLPFPNYLKEDFSAALIEADWVDQYFPIKRLPVRHKYAAGVLYLIAGSEGLTGAAIMAAKSAWAEGLGAVILICPRGLLSVFESQLTQIITRPVGSENDFHFKEEHLDRILKITSEKPGTVIYGPGIGRETDTVALTHTFIEQFEGSLLVDADGLWCLSRREWQVGKNQQVILTPHPGELSRLLDTTIQDDADRLQKVRSFARKQNVTLLSKGYPVILGTAEGTCFLTGYDTRRFSRAGFGDILAGKIGAFWTLTGQAERACFHGLLNGKKKMKKHDEHSSQSHILEPLDLI